MVFFIDIGGTPANVLEKNKLIQINKMPYIIVLDPFDYSRRQRTLLVTRNINIKFSYDKEFPVELSADEIPAPDVRQVRESFEKVKGRLIGYFGSNYKVKGYKLEKEYDKIVDSICKLASKSTSLREFMNGIILVLRPDANIVLLEEILVKNIEKVKALASKYEISARAVCPTCKKFTRINLKDGETCCGVNSGKVLETGKYVCEGGFFPVLVRLGGYLPRVKNTRDIKYIEIAMNVLKELELEGPLMMIYEPVKNPPMFEEYLLRQLDK